MSKITTSLKNEITRQSDVTSKPLRDNFTNYQNAINDNQDQIDALSTSTTNNETVVARGADHASLNERLDSMWTGQPNYLKSGGVVSINGGDAQKVDVTAGEARVDGKDIVWSGDTSETIPFTSANTRFDVVVVNSATTTGGLHLEIVRGAESATPVLPTIADSQKPLWVLTIGTATVTLSWDARDQGCRYFNGGRWAYEWKIQDAIDNLSVGGNIQIGRGTYYETLTYDDSQVLIFEGGTTLKNAGGTTIALEDIDLISKTNTRVITEEGEMASDGVQSIIYRDTTPTESTKLLKTKIIEIGDWNMDTGTGVSVTHNVADRKKIREVTAIIRSDDDGTYRKLAHTGTSGTTSGAVTSIASTTIGLSRTTGGIYDDAAYNSTSFNRGWVTVTYEV